MIIKKTSWQMFDRIAPTYDFLNHFLSLGIDKKWRKKVCMYLPQREGIKLLDIATGTGDLLITLAKSEKVTQAMGVDLSKKMLEKCEVKIRKNQLRKKKKIQLSVENMENLSFGPNSFDVVTIAFGIRNIENPLKALKETYRSLSHEGRLIILELSIPPNFFVKLFYLLYFRYLLPLLGGMISGSFGAYRYLNQTVEDFPQGKKFCDLLLKAGFSKAEYELMTMGIVTLYVAQK